MATKNVELNEHQIEFILERIPNIGNFTIPAELEYDSKIQKMTLKTGWKGVDERYHVFRFIDLSPQSWSELLANL